MIRSYKKLYEQVVRLGPLVVKNTKRNRLRSACRGAVKAGLPLHYKILSQDPDNGLLLMWVVGQEVVAEQMASRYGCHLPRKSENQKRGHTTGE